MYELVGDLCHIHDELCDACEITSEYFSTKMVTIIATGFLCILVNGYFAFVSVFASEASEIGDLEEKMVLYGAVESTFLAAGIIIACNSCQRIIQQVMRH